MESLEVRFGETPLTDLKGAQSGRPFTVVRDEMTEAINNLDQLQRVIEEADRQRSRPPVPVQRRCALPDQAL